MPDNSILQCSVWKPLWTSFSFPTGVGNYGALTIRRSSVNAGSLQYHDLDNNIVYTRSKYGGVWNPPADAAPWERLVNNSNFTNYVKIVTSVGYAANQAAHEAKSITLSYSIPTGYTPIMAIAITTEWQATATVRTSVQDLLIGTINITFVNNFPNAANVSGYANVLCVKN